MNRERPPLHIIGQENERPEDQYKQIRTMMGYLDKAGAYPMLHGILQENARMRRQIPMRLLTQVSTYDAEVVRDLVSHQMPDLGDVSFFTPDMFPAPYLPDTPMRVRAVLRHHERYFVEDDPRRRKSYQDLIVQTGEDGYIRVVNYTYHQGVARLDDPHVAIPEEWEANEKLVPELIQTALQEGPSERLKAEEDAKKFFHP